MGLILVYRANRIINFAQAQLGAVPAVIALLLIAKRGVPYMAVLPIVVLGAALLGAGTEVVLVRRFANAPRLIVTVVTIGVGILLVVMEFFAKLAVGGDLIDTLAFDYNSPVSNLTFRWGVQTFKGDHLMTILIVGVAVVRHERVLQVHRHGHRGAGLGRERGAGVAPRDPGEAGVHHRVGAGRGAVVHRRVPPRPR